jgi:hypothetical protein
VTGPSRRRFLPGLAAAAAGLATLCLFAQSSSDAYRNLYKSWRDADPTLELDAAVAGDAIAIRAAQDASLASAYGAAHAAALKAAATQQSQNLQWLSSNTFQPLPDLAHAADGIRFATRESDAVAASVATFANDPDRVIQQLRQAFQHEQAALQALKTSITQRELAEDRAANDDANAEMDREKALREYTFLSSALAQSADSMTEETAAWTAYYAKLADAAHGAPTPPPPAAPPSAAPASASIAPRPPSITPVPLTRYVGLWSYRAGSAFFGTQPEMVDLAVHEDNGQATGTFFGRFKLPAGSTENPVLRFQFSGDFKPTLVQTFKVTTEDGAAGTIDLNPGVAFNELEINFTTDVTPGKVHQGDTILLKQ